MPRDDAIPFRQQCYIDGAWSDAEGVEYGIVGIDTGIISTEVAPSSA